MVQKTKKFLLFAFMAVLSYSSMAQDVILKKDGSEIQAKVLEITEFAIQYKNFDFQNGPIRNINISEVFMITYEDGKKEVFNKQTSMPATSEKEVTKESPFIPTKSTPAKSFKLSTETSITITNVVFSKDSDHLCLQLKNKLSGIGFKNVTDKVVKKDAIMIENSNVYIPVSIEISVSMNYLGGCEHEYTFSVTDLSNNQLLSDFKYNVFAWWSQKGTNKKAVEQFSDDLSKYIIYSQLK